jgi:hypothetical protein
VSTTVTLAPTVTIHADEFNSAQAAQSVLCLEVGRDRFRLLVQDVRGRAVYLDDYTFPSLLEDRPLTNLLPEVFRDHPVLSAGPWQEVRIGVNSPSFTLVPEPLYRKEYASSYLALMRGSELQPHEFAQAYTHQAEGFLSVFSMEHALADYFSEAYPLQPLLFVHQIGALVQATADLDRRSLTADNVYIYFEDEFITILYRKDHALRYCNRFGYKNVQDMAYYVLYVLEELAVNTQSTPVNLYGEITPFAEGYTELSKFLPHLSFGQPPPGLTLAAEFADLPDHRYLSLYGLSLMSE